MISDWFLQVLLAVFGIVGGGAVWYFMSQKQYYSALWIGTAAAIILLVVIALFIRNDIIKREIQTKTAPSQGISVSSPSSEKEQASAAFKIENSSDVHMEGNVAIGYDHFAEISKSKNITAKDNLTKKGYQKERDTEGPAPNNEQKRQIATSTNEDLKDRALMLVANIREFLGLYQRQTQSIYENEWSEMTQAKDKDDKQKLWNKFTSAQRRLSNDLNAEYDQRFKVDSILLRDELRSRLPDYKPVRSDGFLYEHPTNPIGMGMVADDLEKMAKLL